MLGPSKAQMFYILKSVPVYDRNNRNTLSEKYRLSIGYGVNRNYQRKCCRFSSGFISRLKLLDTLILRHKLLLLSFSHSRDVTCSDTSKTYSVRGTLRLLIFTIDHL